jgi:methylenetetrahydrofolate dehydrogenase (NADP+)/methenyltetrahydrofolate cyclohydrolase
MNSNPSAENTGEDAVSGKIMDGRIVAQKIRSVVKERVQALTGSEVKPNLVTILVGDNPASKTYLKNKHSACAAAGIGSRNIELADDTSQADLHRLIAELNLDQTVTGILLQLPLPKGLDESSAVSGIAPAKDVDGLHPCNVGLLVQKNADLIACTPRGVLAMLTYYGVRISGRHAVVINRSKLVGRPLSQLLLNADATVTVCHSKTTGLEEICKQADILVSGIGHRSQFAVGKAMIKDGATVVDVGTSSVGGKLMGDVDFQAALEVAEYVTPVPGGVGPMTIAMLLYNTVLAACKQSNVDLGFNPDELKATERS